MKKYSILISNDDGINGPGLKPLISQLSKIAKIYVVVPEAHMSGASHSITLNRFRQIKKYGRNIYSLIDGTPADCVKYALYSFLKDKIDLVVAGINTEPNLAQDVVYSGTVACAREGAFLGIPSIAVSVADNKNPCYLQAAKAALEIAETVLKKEKKGRPALCLNVNVPPDYKGIKVMPLGIRHYDETIVKDKKDGKIFYKLAGRFLSGDKNKKSDISVIEEKYISVTPLKLDQTDFDTIKKYSFMEKNFGKKI